MSTPSDRSLSSLLVALVVGAVALAAVGWLALELRATLLAVTASITGALP